jgi:hypothetical protein
MLFILLLAILFWSSYITGKRLREQVKPELEKARASVITEDVPKFCPPHKWFYQEVKDLEGKTVKWKMVCEICGPLKPQDGPARVG